MSETTHLALPFIAAAQAQKHVTHNEALLRLDALLHLSVLTRALSSPPDPSEEGDRYLIGEAASGDWSGRDGAIAAFQDGAWSFLIPRPGWRLWVKDEAVLLIFDGSSWKALIAEVTATPRLGISAEADDYNRLIVSAPASLFSHAGAGHQLKLNKALVNDTASLLFQTGYSGRAEFGLAGDDHFHVKVSADGASWVEAMTIDNPSGAVSFPSGLAIGGAHTRLVPSTSVCLTGLSGGAPARLAVLTNATPSSADARLIILEHDSVSPLSGDRFVFVDRLPRLLMPGDTIALLYDGEAACWRELAPQRLARSFDMFSDAFVIDDFATLVSDASASSAPGLYLTGNAGERPRGLCALATGATASGRAHWGSAANDSLPGEGPALYLVRLAIETLSTSTEQFTVRAGWHDGAASADIANGIYWQYDQSLAGTWMICASSGGDTTRLVTGAWVDSGYIHLGIFLNADWSRADFFSSPTGSAWTFNGSLASASSEPLGFSAGIVKSAGLASRSLSIDLEAMRYDAAMGA
jgi:hypothetical protein